MYNDLHILVIGDIMLDLWREASDYRMYQEAPVPDIHNPESTYTLGGAGNVARIVRELGARAQLIGVLGEFSEYSNSIILDLCDKADIGFYVAYDQRGTTVKERIVCHGQQICRISEEKTTPIATEAAERLFHHVTGLLHHGASKVDGIIIADYSKGVMTEQLKRLIINECDFPILVDPKNDFSGYNGCTIFKPNEKEMTRWHPDWKEHTHTQFEKELGCEYLVITSEEGMIYRSLGMSVTVPVHPVEVANVSGAGDAAAAVMLCEYVKSKDIELAVKMANYAASQIVATEHTGHLDKARMIKFSAELAEQIGASK